MDNPFLRRGQHQKTKHGLLAEKRHAKTHKARLQPGSGALDGAKGDMVREGLDVKLLLESKSTNGVSIALKYEWLRKISREAKDTNAQPILLLSFVTDTGGAKPDGDWVMMPATLFNMLEELK